MLFQRTLAISKTRETSTKYRVTDFFSRNKTSEIWYFYSFVWHEAKIIEGPVGTDRITVRLVSSIHMNMNLTM